MHLPSFFEDAESSSTPDFIPLENDLYEDEQPSVDVAIKAYKEIVYEITELREQQKKLLDIKSDIKKKVIAFDQSTHALIDILKYLLQKDCPLQIHDKVCGDISLALHALQNIDIYPILQAGPAISKAASIKSQESRMKMDILQTSLEDIQVQQDSTHMHQCPICYEHKISRVLNPCGHTACEHCIEFVDRGACYMCRAPIDSVIKIYTN
jgi:ribosomal protein L37AE/L43A